VVPSQVTGGHGRIAELQSGSLPTTDPGAVVVHRWRKKLRRMGQELRLMPLARGGEQYHQQPTSGPGLPVEPAAPGLWFPGGRLGLPPGARNASSRAYSCPFRITR
jgi:hypothetical protein